MGLPSRRRLAALSLFVFLALLSWAAREVHEARFHYLPTDGGPPEANWFSVEPDGLYHARRVERSLAEGLPPAAHDPRMNFPAGAAIPWPPYYDTLLTLLFRPFAPREPAARHAFVERAASTLPLWWGVGTTILLAAAAWRLGGPAAALVAGILHALAYGSIHYTVPGIADHHAFVGLLLAALLLSLGEGLRRGAAHDPRVGLRSGIVCGLLAGLLLGVWVAALEYVVAVDAMIGILLLGERGREGRAGLGAFGLSFHLIALLALAPALALSPWFRLQPWSVVDLSQFHPSFLLLGAAVCAPLLFLRTGGRARRLYPWVVAGGLTLLGLFLVLLPLGPGAGLREAFAWSARNNAFMAGIAESQPLLGHDPYAPPGLAGQLFAGGAFLWLGFGSLLIPFAWVSALRQVHVRPALLPWLIVAPMFLLLASIQRRFSAAASLPLALLLGWWLAERLPRLGRFRLALLLFPPLLLQAPSLASGVDRLRNRRADRSSQEALRQNGIRWVHEWIASHSEPGVSVLAHWDQGHALEFVAATGSVATNFGSYVGEESFRDDALFFTASDFPAAEAILQRHRSRFVLVHTIMAAAWGRLKTIAGSPSTPWGHSLLASLFFIGSQAPSYLRLVAVSPFPDLSPPPRLVGDRGALPAAFLWEHVRGARLRIGASPGTEVALEIPVSFPGSGWSFTWTAQAHTDETGWAEFRVPYPSDAVRLHREGHPDLSFSVSEKSVERGETRTIP